MIVNLTGGLANQLFMYAFGRGVSAARSEAVTYHWTRSTWDFALEKFDLPIKLELAARPPIYEERTFAYDHGVYSAAPDTYFKGYWQTEKYFQNLKGFRQSLALREIRQDVALKAKQFQNENSFFIHVRRGDYMNQHTRDFHGNLWEDGDYYQQAISYVRERIYNPKFYIFTDDPVWCKKNFEHELVFGFQNHEDLYLMSKCRHGIGANSSFSWWGNWWGDYLGRMNIVPKRWFNNETDTQDLIPDHWIKL